MLVFHSGQKGGTPVYQAKHMFAMPIETGLCDSYLFLLTL